MSLAVPAHGLVLDDFSTGSQLLRISSGTATAHTAAPGAVGGARSLYLGVANNLFGNDATLRVNGGVLSHNDDAGVYSEAEIQYGNDASGVFTPLNLDLSGQDRFRLHFLEADHLVNLNIVVFSVSGASFSAFGVNLGPSATPFTVDAPFSSFGAFSMGGGFDDIDLIVVILQRASGGATASDLAIDKFEAVPEPASLIAFGGLAGLAAMRKGRSRKGRSRKA
jgi:hypothetical protein